MNIFEEAYECLAEQASIEAMHYAEANGQLPRRDFDHSGLSNGQQFFKNLAWRDAILEARPQG